MKAAFAKYDANNSGKLEAGEIEKVIQELVVCARSQRGRGVTDRGNGLKSSQRDLQRSSDDVRGFRCFQRFCLEVFSHWEIKGWLSKRMVLATCPCSGFRSGRFSFQGNIRMYPRSGFRSGGTSAKTTFQKPPFCQPQAQKVFRIRFLIRNGQQSAEKFSEPFPHSLRYPICDFQEWKD